MIKNFRHLQDIKSYNLSKMMTQYSDRKELVDFIDQTQFNYMITIPCHHMNYSEETFQRKIKDFLSLLSHFVFTKNERNRKFEIENYSTFESRSHIHILIAKPQCKKIDELEEDEIDNFIKSKVIRVLQKLKMFNLNHVDKTQSKFFKKIKNFTEQFVCLNYNTKEYTNDIRRFKNSDKLFSTIDFNNFYVKPTLC